MDGQVIGEVAAAPVNGTVWVPLNGGVQPIPHRNVVAIQVLGGVPSSESPFPIEVSEVPLPLPTPVIVSQLNTCMADVWLDGLVPGATVKGSLNGAPFGNSKAAATAAMLGAPVNAPIPSNAVLEVWQEANVAGGMQASALATSLPIAQFVPPLGHRQPLPPPRLQEPLFACDTSRLVLEAVPGAVTVLTQENGAWESFLNTSSAFSVFGGMSLMAGKLTVRQEMKRCDHDGTEATVVVQPMATPPAPVVSHEICPNMLRITASNLLPGGELIVMHEKKIGEQVSSTEVGRAGISKPVESFDLPPSVDLTDPWLDPWLVVLQSRCGSPSTRSNPVRPTQATQSPRPKIVEPLFDCTRHVRIEGARPGAHLHLAEAGTGYMLSDAYQATSSSAVLKLWFPAKQGQKIFLHQRGCGADWNTDPATEVQPLPNPLPRPDIVEPVRPDAASIRVRGVIPGAIVHLLVDGVTRTSVESLTDDTLIAVPPPALADQQTVFAIQTLCGRSSAAEGRPVVVRRGQLKLDVKPKKMMRESKSTLRIDASDADSGAPVTGQIFLNGTSVGMTGQNISYTPTATEPNPTGFVRAPGYLDESFTITLNSAAWKLEVRLGTGRSDIGPIPVYVDTVHVAVTPAWNAALGTTLSRPGTMSYGAIEASTTLPGPFADDSPQTVTVTITVTCSSPGGNLNGWEFEPMSGQIVTRTSAVAYDGVGKRIGYAFTSFYNEYEPDEGYYGGDIVFAGIEDI